MSISITLTAVHTDDLRSQLRCLLGLSDGAVQHVAETTRPAAPVEPKPLGENKRSKPKAAEKPAAEPTKELPNDPVDDIGRTPVEQTAAEPLTDQDVIDIGKKLAEVKGLDAVRAMLKDFGVERMTKIPEGQRAEWVAKCKTAIAA
jgi:hypothetical protein